MPNPKQDAADVAAEMKANAKIASIMLRQLPMKVVCLFYAI